MLDRRCEQCGTAIGAYQGKARFCSGACRARAHRAAKRDPIPEVMRSSDRWVRWRHMSRGDKTTKVPVTTRGQIASTRDPATWTTYRAAKRSPVGAGIGWVLGEGVGCIDLDKCFDGGKLADWAQVVVDRHRGQALLIERSQSGMGLHIFLPMGEGGGSVIRDGRNIETYPPGSGRYIAVTGDVFRG